MERIFLQGIWYFSALEKSLRTDWAPKKADASRLTLAVICYKIDFTERIGPATCLPTVVFFYTNTNTCKLIAAKEVRLLVNQIVYPA